MFGTIYRVTCLVNQKIYIGQTILSPQQNPFKGKHHTEETKKHLSEYSHTQGKTGAIERHLQGKQENAGGYHWRKVILEDEQAVLAK